ncbi:MAG: hypothetical protein PF484_00585 [Bacteroidales bacterium]|jgi:hypothetical protein|nr:hypothetical protein [Bacteroidales bacterium]
MFSNTKIPAIVISISIGLFLAAAWFGYKHLDVESINPLQAFPENTAFILELPEPQIFFENLNKGNDFWLDLISNKKTNEFSQFFNALLTQSKGDEKLELFFKQPFYISLIKNNESTSDVLLITKQSDLNLRSLDTKLFSKLKGMHYSAPIKDSMYAKIATNSTNYYLSQSKGLFIISTNSTALQSVQDQLLDEKEILNSPDFNKLKMTRGKRADAYLYVAYSSSDFFLKSKLSPNSQLKSSSFANYSVLDIKLKKDELLLNGYTSAFDSLNQYLAAFKNQKSQKSQLPISLPYFTESFISINLSDYRSFIEKQTQLAQLQKERSLIDKLINANSIAITEQWWAGEMALVIDEKQREYAVFTAKSGRDAFRYLSDIAHQSQPRIITETYREQKIKEINSEYFLTSQFGTLFSGFKKVYFCVIDEAVIFSKSLPDIKKYIDALILGNNLSKNESYIEFSDNLSDDAIIRIYSKSPKVSHPIFDLFSSKDKSLFNNYPNLVENIQGIGVQISNKNNLLYTGIFISHGKNTIEKSSAWQIELEAPLAAGPFIVKNHSTEGNSMLIQDEFNILYFFNEKGDIVWTQALKETIKSQVFAVDYYKNGKWQYLFNSKNFLYLIDITGNTVGNYPIQLNSDATNSLQVLDYDNKKKYRLVIAGKNGELYNYELNGRLLKDWQAENTRKEISKPLTHLITNNKDYLIFEASNGDIIMTDRRGRKRMEVRQSFTNALGSDIYVNRTNRSKGMMITTDTEGNLVYIPTTGQVIKTSFGKMSEKHFFLYADFTGNSEMDFIYLDDNKLRVFDKFKKVLLSYDFNNPISLKPQLFTINNNTILGVVDQTEKQIYLFDKNGLIDDKTRKGNTNFVIGKLNKNAAPSLLIGFDKSIYNYPLD